MGTLLRHAGIYMIQNIESKKCYIGHSIHITKRWYSHKYTLRRNEHINQHLQKAWNKYGEEAFIFSIIKRMPQGLTLQEYEEEETKWVLHYNSHKTKYGYNAMLPGTIIPEQKEGTNICNINANKNGMSFICINTITGETIHASSVQEVFFITNIPLNKISELHSYWRGGKGRRSVYNWMLVKEEDYDPSFDYINYKKVRTDYSQPNKVRKVKALPKPHAERNLKRISIIAENIITGEERIFTSIKEATVEFDKTKIYKCINAPFRQYKHRGYFFKRNL